MENVIWESRLADEAKRLDARDQQLTAEIDARERERRDIRAERAVVERWRRDPPQFLTQIGIGDEAGSPPFMADKTHLPSPTIAVDALIGEEPGLARREVVDRLENAVNSGSPNVRTVLSSAISRRITQEKVWQDEDGHLWPWDHADAVYQRSMAPRRAAESGQEGRLLTA